MINNITKLEKKLNIVINNKNIFLRALTHKSSNLEFNNESQIVKINERVYNDLEFFVDNENLSHFG